MLLKPIRASDRAECETRYDLVCEDLSYTDEEFSSRRSKLIPLHSSLGNLQSGRNWRAETTFSCSSLDS